MVSPLESFLSASERGQALVQGRQAAQQQAAQRDLQLEQQRQEISSNQRRTRLLGAQLLQNVVNRVKQVPNLEQRLEIFQRARPELEQYGVSLPENITIDRVSDEGLVPLETGIGQTVSELTGAERQFRSLTEGLTPEEVQQAKKIELGLSPRASTSAQERIAADPNVTKRVAESREQIKSAEARGAGEGQITTKAIEKGFESIGNLESNNGNLRRALSALDRGGKTGAFQRFIPSLTEASRELQQIQNQLGLDVVGSVTFGALSEGELNLALSTALDLGQDENALRRQIEEKIAAQEKLVQYLDEQIQFLEDGGTVGEWRAFARGRSSQGGQASPSGQSFTSSNGIQFTVQ